MRLEATHEYGLLIVRLGASAASAFSEGKLVAESKGVIRLTMPISLSDDKAPCFQTPISSRFKPPTCQDELITILAGGLVVLLPDGLVVEPRTMGEFDEKHRFYALVDHVGADWKSIAWTPVADLLEQTLGNHRLTGICHCL